MTGDVIEYYELIVRCSMTMMMLILIMMIICVNFYNDDNDDEQGDARWRD